MRQEFSFTNCLKKSGFDSLLLMQTFDYIRFIRISAKLLINPHKKVNENSSTPSFSRRKFIKGSFATATVLSGAHLLKGKESKRSTPSVEQPEEWRNRQPDMAYRRLGRTGFMVSEIALGGSGPFNNPEDSWVFEEAIERGVNYVDSASRYRKGNSELGWGEFVKKGYRDRLFITTKLSDYYPVMIGFSKEILKTLPSEKQQSLRKKAEESMARRGLLKPGYFFELFGGHGKYEIDAYLCHQIISEYGLSNKWKSLIEEKMDESLHGSLKRLGVETVDVLHFPHGCCTPEDLELPLHRGLAEKYKKQGKIRFNGFSTHTDQPRILDKAAELGHIDVAVAAYNIANQGSMELPIYKATQSGMGIMGMKGAKGVVSDDPKKPVPAWRIAKLNQTIPNPDLPTAVKGYLWVLQNPNVTGVLSEFSQKKMILENIRIVGKRVELQKV